MNGLGKIIGGFLGFILAGPGGFLLGILWGHIFDKGIIRSIKPNKYWQYSRFDVAQRVFFESTFRVMGYIAKLDGRVSEAEIQTARRAMQRMGLSEPLRQEAIRLFNQGKQSGFTLQPTLQNLIRTNRYNQALLQLFIEMQFQTALAEGRLTSSKGQALKRICEYLGFNTWQFNLFGQLFQQGYQQSTHSQQSQQQPSNFQTQNNALRHAYALLELSPRASDAEVKQAYRRLISQYHPDKSVAKGLPEATVRAATQKTQNIKAAYERICVARGL